jgi:catechol 2,3-dioxygenase-like lactoylglutathione lyase family enzyme
VIRIKLTSVMVDDQAKARDFYTHKLGFVVKHDVPLGEYRWLTVVTADDPDGSELVLEPVSGSSLAESTGYQKALYNAGIPATAFMVDDLDAEYARLKGLGVEFRGEPTKPETGPATVILNDTCGNLIQLVQT